jgi:hypothetical protein
MRTQTRITMVKTSGNSMPKGNTQINILGTLSRGRQIQRSVNKSEQIQRSLVYPYGKKSLCSEIPRKREKNIVLENRLNPSHSPPRLESPPSTRMLSLVRKRKRKYIKNLQCPITSHDCGSLRHGETTWESGICDCSQLPSRRVVAAMIVLTGEVTGVF